MFVGPSVCHIIWLSHSLSVTESVCHIICLSQSLSVTPRLDTSHSRRARETPPKAAISRVLLKYLVPSRYPRPKVSGPCLYCLYFTNSTTLGRRLHENNSLPNNCVWSNGTDLFRFYGNLKVITLFSIFCALLIIF